MVLSAGQLQVLRVLCEEGPLTPYGVCSKLGWRITRYPSARQACEYLVMKGFAWHNPQPLGNRKREVYQPNFFGLLELICTPEDKLPRRKLIAVLSSEQSRTVFPLLKRFDANTQETLIDAFRETWRRIRLLRRTYFDGMSMVRSSEDFRRTKGRPQYFHITGLYVVGKDRVRRKVSDRESYELAWPWDTLEILSGELENEFYAELFTGPFRDPTTPAFKRMRTLIMNDIELKHIAKQIIEEKKSQLIRDAISLERLEEELNTTDSFSDLRTGLERFIEGRHRLRSSSDIAKETLKVNRLHTQ